jgi:hypothetical protein
MGDESGAFDESESAENGPSPLLPVPHKERLHAERGGTRRIGVNISRSYRLCDKYVHLDVY